MYYKYRNISEWTENYILKKEIWAAKPDTLNDPFECDIPKFTKSEIESHCREIMQNQLSGFIMEAYSAKEKGEVFFTIQGREIRLLLNKIKKASWLNKKYKIANNFLKKIGHSGFSNPQGQSLSVQEMIENVGIFSLSEDPLNMLMWSHYGDNHNGLAIGFEAIEGSDLAKEEYFQPVNYSDDPLRIDLSKGLMNGVTFYLDEFGRPSTKAYVQIKDPQIQKIFFTKTTDWAYEKEWRYLRQEFGEYKLPGKLSRIVFGMNCKDQDKKRYIELCRQEFEHDIDYFEIFRIKNTTKLDLKRVHNIA